MEHSSAVACVQVAGTAIQKITYRDQHVVTFAMIDRLHGRVDGTAGRSFRENRDRFINGHDYAELTSDEIRRMSSTGVFPERTARGILLTRRGYLKIVKSLNDDKAWEVFDEMISRYFAVATQAAAPSLSVSDLIANPQHLLAITQGYALKVEEMRHEMTTMQGDVQALERIAGADDLFGVRETAKMLHMPERKFVDWLRRNKWAYRQPGTSSLLCYADKDRAGLCRNVGKSYKKGDGTPAVTETLKFTGAGLVKLAKALNVAFDQGDMFREAAE